MARVANAIRDIVDAAVIRTSEREVGMIIVSQQGEVLQSIQEIEIGRASCRERV